MGLSGDGISSGDESINPKDFDVLLETSNGYRWRRIFSDARRLRLPLEDGNNSPLVSMLTLPPNAERAIVAGNRGPVRPPPDPGAKTLSGERRLPKLTSPEADRAEKEDVTE